MPRASPSGHATVWHPDAGPVAMYFAVPARPPARYPAWSVVMGAAEEALSLIPDMPALAYRVLHALRARLTPGCDGLVAVSHAELARVLGVARPRISEALAALRAHSLVLPAPRRGEIRVSPWVAWCGAIARAQAAQSATPPPAGLRLLRGRRT